MYASRLILLVAFTLNLTGCGKSSFIGHDPGKDCLPTETGEGISLVCADGTIYEINNGREGLPGIDGIDGVVQDVYKVIPLCPLLNGVHKEVVLKIGDDLISYFAQDGDAKKARLTLLEEGVLYSTTDTNKGLCNFTVLDGGIVYEQVH